MVNGNDIIEFIESKNGALEEEFIEAHKEEFDKFCEEQYTENRFRSE